MILTRQDDHHHPQSLFINLADLLIDDGDASNVKLSLTPVDQENSKPDKTTTVLDCTTPKAKEYKIPDVVTCPPAPRKRKAAPLSVKKFNMSRKVRVVKFFSSPEIESVIGINSRVSSKLSWNSVRRQR
ncbi:uncharacterized protein LOC126688060 [Mercurialis annua]|uniref:uncharacterized protein LOC126688060 n=1 Tax=Mercurialis annua TaxID=3986 RepID=UPI00215DD562|nr:uncharacterized protein LOC126688060 [Mercurialis annua]